MGGEERVLVEAGGGSRNWSDEEIKIIKETKSNGKLSSIISQRGYTGHHINSVKGNGALGGELGKETLEILFFYRMVNTLVVLMNTYIVIKGIGEFMKIQEKVASLIEKKQQDNCS
ncbi:hypothetical protein [Xenorhabdus japonica]|uniref:Uncharacterized protein n=1 Tax=Xenorhabdus japonica TaxID=53341 RepID=A0A1I5D7H5_9GAMM|nr:hypothetical protein [Xenorhabdus japonica]SFN95162.1 hypothetical protein SAMN05421579_1362 [Xenorhabdus japonica]